MRLRFKITYCFFRQKYEITLIIINRKNIIMIYFSPSKPFNKVSYDTFRNRMGECG